MPVVGYTFFWACRWLHASRQSNQDYKRPDQTVPERPATGFSYWFVTHIAVGSAVYLCHSDQKIYFSIRMRVSVVGALVGPMTRADRTKSTSPQTDCTSTQHGTHLFISAILMLDQDGGFDLLLLLMASCLLTQKKRTQVNGEQTQKGVREQQHERKGISHLVVSVSILDNLGCFIKLPLLTI